MRSMTNNIQVGVEGVIDQIIRRYSNPSRTTFMYLFRLPIEADFSGIIPAETSILTAWVDEGGGFQLTPPADAVALCTTIRALHLIDKREHRFRKVR